MIKLLSELQSEKFRIWFMHKKGKLRLRVFDVDAEIIQDKIKKYQLKSQKISYEPEIALFGGVEAIELVHKILCNIAEISICIKSYSMTESKEKGIDTCLCLNFINKLLDYCDFDDFEKWDIWNKTCEHREINMKVYGGLLLSKMYDVYQVISSKDFDIYFLEDSIQTKFYFDELKKNCRELLELSYSTQLTRGIRGIFSAIIIFTFNMMRISAQQQCGFVHIMRILTNPDFRREVGI